MIENPFHTCYGLAEFFSDYAVAVGACGNAGLTCFASIVPVAAHLTVTDITFSNIFFQIGPISNRNQVVPIPSPPSLAGVYSTTEKGNVAKMEHLPKGRLNVATQIETREISCHARLREILSYPHIPGTTSMFYEYEATIVKKVLDASSVA